MSKSKRSGTPSSVTSSGTDGQYQYYQVDEILGCKIDEFGRKLYRIKWTGYDEQSWEPEHNLNCPKLVESYEKAMRSKPAGTSSEMPSLKIPSRVLRKVNERRLGDDAKQVLLRYLQDDESQYDSYRNMKPDEIVGVTYITGDLRFLIKWKGYDRHDLVPYATAKARYPDAVIGFFEQCIVKTGNRYAKDYSKKETDLNRG